MNYIIMEINNIVKTFIAHTNVPKQKSNFTKKVLFYNGKKNKTMVHLFSNSGIF